MQRFWSFIAIISLLSFNVFAQSDQEEEGIDTKTLAFGAITGSYTSVFGGVVVRSSIPLGTKNGKTSYQYLAIEGVNIKSPREYSEFYGIGPKYTLGKRNYLLSLRPQYGREFTFFERNKDDGIGMGMIVSAGPSLGFLKPYFVKYEDNNVFVQYDPKITRGITGVGGILKNGLKGIKFTPGIHLKVASNIDINTFSDNVSGLEIGLNMEYFFKEPEILASSLSENSNFFAGAYLTLYFGNKRVLQPKKSKKSKGID